MLSQNNNNKIRVYPNPVRSILHISSNENYKVNVYDLSGKLVLQQKVNNSLNLSMLPSATYLMSLSDIDGKILEQFTIIKKIIFIEYHTNKIFKLWLIFFL